MFAFVRRPPVVVDDLAAALAVRLSDLFAADQPGAGWGSLKASRLTAAVETVSAECDWDCYHEAPITSAEDLTERWLLRYAIRFTAGRRACEAQLRAAYGAPVLVAGRRWYEPFFVRDADDDGFVLEWFASIPDWALPPVDAEARVRAVEQVAARVALASSQPELAAALADVPADTQITASWNGLRFEPPMPAADLARALGHPTAVGQTIGVHMSSWVLVRVAGDRTARLRVGRWRVDSYLDAGASGGDVPGVDEPASRVAYLGTGDVVSQVEFVDR